MSCRVVSIVEGVERHVDCIPNSIIMFADNTKMRTKIQILDKEALQQDDLE